MRDYNIEKLFIIVLLLIASIYILSGAYVGINGHHSWRQADVYGHILGFLHYKDFTPFDRFLDGHAVFDIPIYQWIIAKVSYVTNIDSLVVANVLSYTYWLISIISGYVLSNSIGKKYTGIIFLFLMSTSPLILHYFSVPLPDTMSIAFSLASITILQKNGINLYSVIIIVPLFIIATLIKSPIPFIFIIFYTVYLFFRDYDKKNIFLFIRNNSKYILLLFLLFIIAIFAELLRKHLLGNLHDIGFAQNPIQYFGSLELRLSKVFWETIVIRLNSAGPYMFSIIYLITIILALIMTRSKNLLVVTMSSLLTFGIGWLTFSNLYKIHDYYELPVTIIIFISFSISVSYILEIVREKWFSENVILKVTAIILVSLMTIHLLMTQKYISNRHRVDFVKSVEFILKKENIFLHVMEKSQNNPTFAGMVSTKTKQVTLKEFNKNCDYYFNTYKSILIEGTSQCLEKNNKKVQINQYAIVKDIKKNRIFIYRWNVTSNVK